MARKGQKYKHWTPEEKYEINEMVEHDNIYKVLVTEYKQNGESDEYYLSVGYSYKEAIDSLNYLKKTILDNGEICH